MYLYKKTNDMIQANEIRLELKHVLPYLHTNIKAIIDDEYTQDLNIRVLNSISLINIKLVLRPLSDLTKEIEHNGEKFIPIEKIYDYQGWEKEELKELIQNGTILGVYSDEDLIPYSHAEKLFEWHFDVFDLHSKNLCIYYDEIK